jgi:MFS family permease
MSQIFGSYLVETTGKRRFIFLSNGIVHRALWIPVALIPIFLHSAPRDAIIWAISILITVSSVAASVSTIAFNSWMGDLVPTDIIGRFFGKRTLVSTASATLSALVIGVVLDRINNMTGFAIVFAGGAVFGLVDICTFFFIKHPPLPQPKSKPSLLGIIKEPFRNKNYMSFVVFATVYAFGVNVIVPFFNTYMLETLKMNYLMINLACTVTTGITTILVVRQWGVIADRYGNRPVLLLTALCITFVPLPWLLTTPTNCYWIFLANTFSGLTWSGYNLAVFNESIWLAPEHNRSAYTACYTFFTSAIGTALAYVCGGGFMQYTTPWFEHAHIMLFTGSTLNSFFVLLIISVVLRLLAIVFFFGRYTSENARPVSELTGDIVGHMRPHSPK